MIIDPRHLEQLAVIVDVGTLNGAAARIGTSQPALSRMIRTLESRVGAPLFARDSRPLQPTPLGLELAKQGRAIRVAQDRAREAVDLGAAGFDGTLRIGAPPFLCEKLVSEAIAGFVIDRPDIRIDLVPDYFPSLHERLFQNEIDIIVGPAKSADPTIADMVFEPLFEDFNVVVGRADHPLLEVGEIDLDTVTWIGHSDRSMLRHDMETALRLKGASKIRFAFQSEAAGAVIEMLKNSDFLTVLPRYAVRTDQGDSLAVFPIDLSTSEQTIAMMTSSRGDEARLTSEFKDHLRRYVAMHIAAPLTSP